MIIGKYKFGFRKKPYLAYNRSSVEKTIIDFNRHNLFTKEHPLKTILKLSMAPFLVIMINATYQVSDAFITAALTNETILINGVQTNVATVAINTSVIVYIPLWGVAIGLVQGGLAWFTKVQGMQNPKLMGVYNSSSIVIITFLSFVASIIMLNSGKGLLELGLSLPNKADNDLIIKESFRYIWPRMATLPVICMYLYSVRLMRILNVRFWSVLPYALGVFLNLLLDYIFIVPAHLGIFGSGLATGAADILSTLVAVLMLIFFMRKERPEVKLFRPSLKTMGQIVIMGLPQMLNFILASVLAFFVVRWSSQIGTLGVASASRVVSAFAIYPVYGFIQGATIALTYNYGFKNYKRLHSLSFWLLFVSFSYYIIFTFILMFLAKDVLNILGVDDERGNQWIKIMYSVIALLAFADSMRAYYMATHQKIKIAFTILLTTLAPVPFLYWFGVILQDQDLYWYAYVVGRVIIFVVISASWFMMIKRYIMFKKQKKINEWKPYIKKIRKNFERN